MHFARVYEAVNTGLLEVDRLSRVRGQIESFAFY